MTPIGLVDKRFGPMIRGKLQEICSSNGTNADIEDFFHGAPAEFRAQSRIIGARHLIVLSFRHGTFNADHLHLRSPIILKGIGRTMDDQLHMLKDLCEFFLHYELPVAECDRYVRVMVQCGILTKRTATHWFVPKLGRKADHEKEAIMHKANSIAKCLQFRHVFMNFTTNPKATMQLLLLSNSTMAHTKYMSWVKPLIGDFLKPFNVSEILFIPFAGVTITWDRYTEKVREALPDYKIRPIHNEKDVKESVKNAQAIMIGGGNTFHLLYRLYEFDLIEAIRDRVQNGNIPYVGWSAGSNVAGPDIGTTNDMPIIFPPTDKALNLVPYNLNPHYSEWVPPNFQGETRIDRLNECVMIKKRPILAYSEGLGIRVDGASHTILAPKLPEEFLKMQKDERVVKIWNHHKGTTEVETVGLDTEILTEIKRLKKD